MESSTSRYVRLGGCYMTSWGRTTLFTCWFSLLSGWTLQDKELRDEQQRRKRAEAAAQHGIKERAAVKQGKKPYYPKKCKTSFLIIPCCGLFLFEILRICSRASLMQLSWRKKCLLRSTKNSRYYCATCFSLKSLLVFWFTWYCVVS